MLRVWRLLPPRKAMGAASTTRTDRPRLRAVSAAHSAALPWPSTRRSNDREKSKVYNRKLAKVPATTPRGPMTPFSSCRTLIAALLAVPLFSAAQNFPTRPVTLTVGFAPGGGTDTAARVIAKKLTDNIGQAVVVENRAGAGGNIAAE